MKNNTIKNNTLNFREFTIELTEQLLHFLHELSEESKKRFGPHPFTKDGIFNLFQNNSKYKLFVAIDTENNSIIAYTIVKLGWLDFEYPRLNSYNLAPTNFDGTIAPSVSDRWQNRGVGSVFLQFIINELSEKYAINRLFLWGGVQSSNNRAVAFYKKNGFKTLGEFEYNGSNLDMMLDIN